jgi:hypothetical protein
MAGVDQRLEVRVASVAAGLAPDEDAHVAGLQRGPRRRELVEVVAHRLHEWQADPARSWRQRWRRTVRLPFPTVTCGGWKRQTGQPSRGDRGHDRRHVQQKLAQIEVHRASDPAADDPGRTRGRTERAVRRSWRPVRSRRPDAARLAPTDCQGIGAAVSDFGIVQMTVELPLLHALLGRAHGCPPSIAGLR